MARAKDVEGSAKVPLPEPFLSFHKHPNSLDGDNDDDDGDDEEDDDDVDARALLVFPQTSKLLGR